MYKQYCFYRRSRIFVPVFGARISRIANPLTSVVRAPHARERATRVDSRDGVCVRVVFYHPSVSESYPPVLIAFVFVIVKNARRGVQRG